MQRGCSPFMSMRTAILLFVFVLTALPAARGQEIKPSGVAPPQIATAPPASDVPQPKPGEFHDKGLDLYFNYPVEMTALDGSVAMERGHQKIFGASGENDPEHQEAKRCIRFLLDADLPEDKAPNRPASLDGVWAGSTEDDKAPRKPAVISASIVVMEIVRDCLPEELQKNENDALGTIALSFVSEPGIEPMSKPIWYEVGNQKIHMNSGAGRLTIHGDPQPDPIFIMSMTTEWKGHFLAWVFTSNDTEIFNEITKSIARFGDGPWGPMYPANIGPNASGPPLKILPN